MTATTPRRGTAPRLAALALLFITAACDRTSPVQPIEPPPSGDGVAAVRVDCQVDVARETVDCDAQDAAPQSGGAALDLRTVGGQGMFVRLASSNVTFAGGVFGMDVSVQNLSNLAFGTQDGAARHADGVRVFFSDGPASSNGAGEVDVANPTGTAFFTAASQPYFQYGGTVGGVDGAELGGDGILTSAEQSAARRWEFQLSGGASRFTFTVYVSTQTPPGTLSTVAPQVTSVSPATLAPGTTATLTGVNFDPTPGANQVTIGGTAATVTAASATSLEVTVPCMTGGTVAVVASRSGMTGMPKAAPLLPPQHTLAPGQTVLVPASQTACNVLMPAGGTARYVMAVYNLSTSTSANAPTVVSDGAPVQDGPAASRLPVEPWPALSAVASPATRGGVDEAAHGRLLERNAAEGERLRAHFARDPRMRARWSLAAADPVEPPVSRTIRVPSIHMAQFCRNFTQVNATRVYYSGKVAIYEDADNTPAALKASANPAMQDYYNRIGDQYNADMEPVIRENFGDPLARDAVTDNNGVVVALFTPLINNNNPGTAGFVVSCDQYPNDSTAGTPVNSSSNFGQYFYAYQPTATGTGYASFTPDSWYWSIRATFIHETKHVVSFATRAINGAPFESGWLEEGTARHAEELWARNAIYNVAWKGNTGYGSAAAPGSIYCDWRREAAVAGGPACLATDPARPSLNVYRHVSSLYNYMVNGRFYSVFGATTDDANSNYYATSWSLVRYAIDKYGSSDAAFLGALTQSLTTGTTNLSTRAGVPMEQLMGEWALALAMDDYPGMPVLAGTPQMPTWNLRSIYAGLNGDPLLSFTRAWPIRYTNTTPMTLGSLPALNIPTLRGGGVAWVELTGTHTSPQLLRLTGGSTATPAALGNTVRVAIGRVE